MQQLRKTIANPYQPQIATPSGKEKIPLGSGVITGILGQGGMASVYEIWNPHLEMHRAVKLVHPNCSEDTLNRFDTEIKITAKLHHPNIIEIHGVGAWNGLPFIEMEKIDGITQEKLILERGAIPIPVALSIGLMVARALEYAHNHDYQIYEKQYHGVIHRDLKPGNIMICTDGIVKLMDFGIARPTDASFHTIDGTVVGTLQYLSPEQLEGKNLDVRTDIYSFGVCMYEMITGHLAFPEPNISRLLSDKAKNRFRPLDEYDLKIPSKLAQLIEKCMQQDPNRRLPDASRLCAELSFILHKFTHEIPEKVVLKYLENPEPKPNRVFLRSRKSRVAMKVGQISLLCLMGVLASYVVYSYLPASPESTESEEPVVSSVPQVQTTISEKAELKLDAQVNTATVANEKPNPVSKETDVTKPLIRSTAAKKVTTEPSPASTPQVSKATTPAPSRSLLEILKNKHGTDNLLEILSAEVREGNGENALNIYNEMPADMAKSNRALVLKVRALDLSGKGAALATFLNGTNVDEAEILIAKAKLAIRQGKTQQASTFLDRASRSPAELLTYEKTSSEIFYYKALCATATFDANPDEANWKEALGAWYLVKKEMRNEPGHQYFRKAESETARIGEKYRSLHE